MTIYHSSNNEDVANYKTIENEYGVPVRLMANSRVPIEERAIRQALDILAMPGLEDSVREMVLTPDLHIGSGIPVGVAMDASRIVPGMIGKDIGCGMRLMVIEDVSPDEVRSLGDGLSNALRQIFFGGERAVFTSPIQREAIFREGLYGLLETYEDNARQGLWENYDPDTEADNLLRVHNQGSYVTAGVFKGYGNYIQGSGHIRGAESQLGSLGGGNHFCELNYIESVHEQTAFDWGLRPGSLVVFVHSGSLNLGSLVGSLWRRRAGAARDELEVLDPETQAARDYIEAMQNATNFAFANRLVLELMCTRAIEKALGRRATTRLVYDAPHNFIEEVGSWRGEPLWRHRKGATPALGSSATYPSGHPVLLPGSMGTSSWILAGNGAIAALESVSHGAGRLVSRQAASRRDDDALDKLRVITPIDPKRARPDIRLEHEKRLREEAPSSYKDIAPVIDSVVEAGAARRVAELKPILTVKG